MEGKVVWSKVKWKFYQNPGSSSISFPHIEYYQLVIEIEMISSSITILFQDMVVLYDSLQLAHKCILNSFYGYVMRKYISRSHYGLVSRLS